MAGELYSKKVLEHFKHPKNLGEMKNPDAIGKVGNPVCVIPKTKICANDEFVEINNVKIGEKVLGCDGFYGTVEKTFERNFSGKIIEIKNQLGLTVLTPEHEILAVKIPKRWKYTLTKNKKALQPNWFHAQELEKSDYVVYPILKEEKDVEELEFGQSKKKFDYRSKKIPEKIKIDDDFLRLAGYYLAEGHLRDKVTKTYLGFTFNLNENDLAEDVEKIVKKIFGIETKRKTIKERNTLVVEVNNVWVVRLFKKLFGNGAANKKIPIELMLLPSEKQKSLLYGLWKGDGFFNEKIPRAGYATISYQLCQQTKTLLLRQKIVPSIYEEKEKISKGVSHKKSYRIHVRDRDSIKKLAEILKTELKIAKPNTSRYWFDENYLYTPLTEYKIKMHTGKVCNLEVKNSKSYTTESLILHNCGDVLWVYLKIEKNAKKQEIIKDIKVKTMGCVAAIATSSILTEQVKGKTLKEAQKLSKDEIARKLGGLPPIKMHCSLLAIDGLKAAIREYKAKKA